MPIKLHLPRRIRPLDLVLAGAIGAAFFFLALGWEKLDPTRIKWLLAGDHAQELFAWLFSRREAWSWPLGKLTLFPQGIPSSLAYTDGAPLYTLTWRVFSQWLPPHFQILGIWLLGCYALQAVFAFLCLWELEVSRLQSWLGGALAVASPVLLHRLGHAILCAQWMILAAFWLVLRHRSQTFISWRERFSWIALLIFSAGIHPYLFVMLFSVSLVRPMAILLDNAIAEGIAVAGLYLGASLCALYVFFYFGAQGMKVEGFNWYSADLLTYINAGGTSWLLPAFSEKGGQYEGFAYLGLGTLTLLLFVFFTGKRFTEPWLPQGKSARLLFYLCLAFFVFSLGGQVRVAGHWILNLRPLYRALAPITNIFRASGRFDWPLHYTFLLGAVYLFSRRITAYRPLYLVLFLAVALQWTETLTGWHDLGGPEPATLARAAWLENDPALRGAGRYYREVRLVPPYIHDVRCENGYPFHYYIPYALFAYDEGMGINSGILSRQPERAIRQHCASSRSDLLQGRVDKNSIYFLADFPTDEAAALRANPRMRCGRRGEIETCVSAERDTPLLRALTSSPEPIAE